MSSLLRGLLRRTTSTYRKAKKKAGTANLSFPVIRPRHRFIIFACRCYGSVGAVGGKQIVNLEVPDHGQPFLSSMVRPSFLERTVLVESVHVLLQNAWHTESLSTNSLIMQLVRNRQEHSASLSNEKIEIRVCSFVYPGFFHKQARTDRDD